jgi:cytochrome c
MNKTLAITAALAALGLASAAQAQDAVTKLAQEKGCLACHQVDKKVVGPSYKEVAAKYRTEKDAMAKLVKKVREGGQGVWGPVPMPPNPSVSEKDAAVLVKWVLSQK